MAGTPNASIDTSGSTDTEVWKPNEEDCAALAARYPDLYYARGGSSVFSNPNRAAIAAAIAAGVAGDGKHEYGGTVYNVFDPRSPRFGSDGGGRYGIVGFEIAGYGFTEPTQGQEHSWNGFVRWRTWFTSNVAYYHSHLGYPGEDPSVTGAMFSSSDHSTAFSTGKAVYLLTPQNDIRVDRGQHAISDGWGDGLAPDAPPRAETGRMIDCRRAGF